MNIISKNPTTEKVIAEFEEFSQKKIDKKLEGANHAFSQWARTSFSLRKKYMQNLSRVLGKEKRRLGEIMTREMGKPITASIAEVEKCAWTCAYFAQNAKTFLSPERVITDAKESYVRFDPLGIVLAIMPWNFPFWQVIRFAAPAIMAGNVGIVKHASNVPQCALEIEHIFLAAGFPKGVFQTLLISPQKVESLIGDPRVRAVTLTGSTRAGSEVASQAGKHIKKTVLELGGSDPFIIFKDANIPLACSAGINARFQNAGQSCIAAKRFIVVKEIAKQFIEQYKNLTERQIVGDPMNNTTSIGPLATEQILEAVATQVRESLKKGAKILLGGKKIPLNGKGYFYEPTILLDVKKGMPAYDEEVFGPVASIIVVKDENEAIAIANDTPFGLGASLWTENRALVNKYAPLIEAGSLFVNGMVKSDPRLPFGGIKQSGYGRELSSYGIKEFTNIKTVWIGQGKTEKNPMAE